MAESDEVMVREVARMLQVSPERVRQLEKAGILPARRAGPTKIRLFSRRTVEAYARRRAARMRAREGSTHA